MTPLQECALICAIVWAIAIISRLLLPYYWYLSGYVLLEYVGWLIDRLLMLIAVFLWIPALILSGGVDSQETQDNWKLYHSNHHHHKIVMTHQADGLMCCDHTH